MPFGNSLARRLRGDELRQEIEASKKL